MFAATSGIVVAAPAHCLIRLRPHRAPSEESATTAIVSELRDNTRGHEIGADFAGIANACLAQLVPAASPPHRVT